MEKCNELLDESIGQIEKIVAEINKSSAEPLVKVQKQDLLFFSDRFSGKIKINKVYDKLLSDERQNMKDMEYVTDNPILEIGNGILKKNAALTLNPYEFVQELIHMLSMMPNVEIYENTEATVIHSLKDKVEVITHNKFKISASKCIVAASTDGARYFKDIDFEVYKNYTMVTEKLLNTNQIKDATFVAVDNNIPGHVIRFDGGHMFVSGEDTTVKEKVANDDSEEKSFGGKYKKLFNYLQKIYIKDKIAKIRNCFYSVNIRTKDGLPLIDEIQGLPNVYCNLAFGANSIAYGCIGAKMLQNICKDYYTKNMYLFRASR